MVKRIALLERNNTFSMFLFLILRRMGFEIMLFQSLSDLIDSDLSLIDLYLVGDKIEDSTTVASVSRLRSLIDDQVRIVVVSTLSSKEVIEKTKEAGAADYIFKPVHPRVLHKVLFSHLEFPSGRRKNLRASTSLDSWVTIDGIVERMSVTSLSRAGALLDTRLPIATGTRLQLDVQMGEHQHSLQGIVIYNRKNQDEGQSGTAVWFSGLDAETANAIDAFLENDLLLAARQAIPTMAAKALPVRQTLSGMQPSAHASREENCQSG